MENPTTDPEYTALVVSLSQQLEDFKCKDIFTEQLLNNCTDEIIGLRRDNLQLIKERDTFREERDTAREERDEALKEALAAWEKSLISQDESFTTQDKLDAALAKIIMYENKHMLLKCDRLLETKKVRAKSF